MLRTEVSKWGKVKDELEVVLLATGHTASYAITAVPERLKILLNRSQVRDIEHMGSEGEGRYGGARWEGERVKYE